jgi:hypothetical protein
MDKRSKTTNASQTIGKLAVCCTMALCGAACTGCKPAARAVEGRVTLAGEPLDEAAIVFVPLEPGRKKTGAQIVDGKYQLPRADGLTPGSYRVEIVDNPPLGDPHGAHAASADSLQTKPPRRVIPYVYAHDSPLSVVISADGPATFDVALKQEAVDRRP